MAQFAAPVQRAAVTSWPCRVMQQQVVNCQTRARCFPPAARREHTPSKFANIQFSSSSAFAASWSAAQWTRQFHACFKLSLAHGIVCSAVGDSDGKGFERSDASSQPNVQKGGFKVPLLVFGDNGKLLISDKSAKEKQKEFLASAEVNPAAFEVKPVKKQKEIQIPKWKDPKGPVSEKVKPKGPQPAPKYSKAARRFYNEKFRKAERLSKVLAAAGIASRRSCEEMIFAGRVTVNGAVCTIPQTPVDLMKDSVYVDGRSVSKKSPPKLYFALNKPKGYICSAQADGSKTALSLIDEYLKVWEKKNPGIPKPRLFTVGRLDVATTGLLLVTNDGEFAQKVAHPSSGLTKEYVATVNRRPTKRELVALMEGTEVDGVKCVPVNVELIEEGAEAAAAGGAGGGSKSKKHRIRIVVGEGRNREVRAIVEAAGLEISALKRVRVGGLRLPRDLGLGKFVMLTKTQVERTMSRDVQMTV